MNQPINIDIPSSYPSPSPSHPTPATRHPPSTNQPTHQPPPSPIRERGVEAQLDYRLLRDLVLYVASPDFATRYPGPSQVGKRLLENVDVV